jgi:hypothetical protein
LVPPPARKEPLKLRSGGWFGAGGQKKGLFAGLSQLLVLALGAKFMAVASTCSATKATFQKIVLGSGSGFEAERGFSERLTELSPKLTPATSAGVHGSDFPALHSTIHLLGSW